MKQINHNVVLIEENGVEKIAMGKGIGFSAKQGDVLDEKKVDKFFSLESKESIRMFSELVSQIPMEYVVFAEELIQYIKNNIRSPLNSNIYVSLTDHIYFAIQREGKGMQSTAIMLPEMELFYPDEFQVSVEVVKRINQRYQTHLDKNEYGFITMHIINAELGEKNSINGLKIMEITNSILTLIKQESRIQLDEQSLYYHRLVLHLKFLAKRLIYQDDVSDEQPFEFMNVAFKNSNHYKIAERIINEIKKKYQLKIQGNEIAYLAIHLGRIR